MIRTLPLWLAACTTAPPPAEAPSALRCTTDAHLDPPGPALAWRGALTVGGGEARLALTRSAVHPDVHGDEPVDQLDASFPFTGPIHRPLALDDGAVALSLAPSAAVPGAWLDGSLVVDGLTEALHCWEPERALPFTYDGEGACVDADGAVGRAALPVAVVRETGVGQCVDLGAQALDEGELVYQDWIGFDLRGADLSAASLHFANLVEADLRGARLDGLDYGYAEIDGTIDAHTALPPEGCEVDGDAVRCQR